MARIAYDDTDAAAFHATRELTTAALTGWRDVVARYLRPRPGMRVLDLGSGTGVWSRSFVDWYGVEVVAVEPAAAMRARSAYRPVLGGDAAAIPLATGSVDAAWLSTMIHHLPDLDAAARELRRVLRPGGRVLIRSPFPGRQGITLYRYFTEAVRILDTYPTVDGVRRAFARAGFGALTLEPVPQTTAASTAELLARLDRRAHTPLALLSDAAYQAGTARLVEAARRDDGPVVDHLDLLVLA